jgi:hypothetical protein
MKKTIIGAIVGGIILFIWQFLSWTILNLHSAQQKYTPKQDSILAYLGTQFSEDGAYMMPTFAQGTPRDEQEKQMKATEGKPWAQISYHKSMIGMNGMFMNMGRGLLVNIVIFLILCWLLTKINAPSFATVFIGTLGIGFISFMNGPYTNHIWYPTFDLMAHFVDTLVAWGAAGLWLGWWLRRK